MRSAGASRKLFEIVEEIEMILGNMFLLKKLLFVSVAAIAFFGFSATFCPGQEEKKEAITFTQADRETLVKYFGDVQERYVKTVGGLNAKQLAFRPNEKSWTVGQVAEHLLISETVIRGMIDEGPLKAALNTNPEVFRMRDIAVTLALTNRGQKFNAPPVVQPQAKVTTADGLVNGFKDARASNIDFLTTTKLDLRNHFADNGLVGMVDAYQWFLFLNGHTERHLAQIDEIMADEGYPAD